MNRIAFESTALDVVYENFTKDVLFYAGTMFVTCDSKMAAKIETALIEAMKCGVIVSKVGPEYAFDFVGE
jgi:hypothetical protein